MGVISGLQIPDTDMGVGPILPLRTILGRASDDWAMSTSPNVMSEMTEL